MADEEERRPLRHLKFREFENVSGDLTADEIRRLYANKMTEPVSYTHLTLPTSDLV